MDKAKTILLIAVTAFVAVAIANRIAPLRAWLSTDNLPTPTT